MMRFAFTIGVIWALTVDRVELAGVYALLAIAWSIPSKGGLRSWLGWDDAIAREQAKREATLFEGRRDE